MTGSINNGGPAFPHSAQPLDAQGNPMCENHTEWGMTLRDWFAGMALQSLVAEGAWSDDGMAKQAYNHADAMIAARSAAPKEEGGAK